MKKNISIFLLLLMVFQPGCASIVGGKYQSLHIETNPPGAHVKTVREDAMGISPTDFSLKRKHEQELIIEKEGYRTRRVFIDNEIRGWFWMNILSWGLAGMLVDVATGAAYKFEPETVTVSLIKE